MSWIKTIAYQDATGRLRSLYDRVKGPDNNVDNVMMVHSLRPHSMEGHMNIYKNVLHHSGNTLPKWFLETLGVWVSLINQCAYCVEHHFSGLQRLLEDDDRAQDLRTALEKNNLDDAPLEAHQKTAMQYAQILTQNPAGIKQENIEQLRQSGFEDGEILEINQVVAYFCYANRTVLGLGVSTQGDIIGLSPNDSNNPDDWAHS